MSWDDAVERLVGSCGSRPAAGSYAATAQLVSQVGVLMVKVPPLTPLNDPDNARLNRINHPRDHRCRWQLGLPESVR